MEIINKILEKLTGGIVSTVIGIILIVSGWKMMKKLNGLSYDSVEVGLFLVGIVLLISNDKWLTSVFTKIWKWLTVVISKIWKK